MYEEDTPSAIQSLKLPSIVKADRPNLRPYSKFGPAESDEANLPHVAHRRPFLVKQGHSDQLPRSAECNGAGPTVNPSLPLRNDLRTHFLTSPYTRPKAIGVSQLPTGIPTAASTEAISSRKGLGTPSKPRYAVARPLSQLVDPVNSDLNTLTSIPRSYLIPETMAAMAIETQPIGVDLSTQMLPPLLPPASNVEPKPFVQNYHQNWCTNHGDSPTSWETMNATTNIAHLTNALNSHFTSAMHRSTLPAADSSASINTNINANNQQTIRESKGKRLHQEKIDHSRMPKEQYEATRQTRVLGRWLAQQEEWSQLSQVLSSTTRAHPSHLLLGHTSSSAWRQRRETADALEVANQDGQQAAPDTWQVTLRGESTTFVSVGNHLSGLYCAVRRHRPSLGEAIRPGISLSQAYDTPSSPYTNPVSPGLLIEGTSLTAYVRGRANLPNPTLANGSLLTKADGSASGASITAFSSSMPSSSVCCGIKADDKADDRIDGGDDVITSTDEDAVDPFTQFVESTWTRGTDHADHFQIPSVHASCQSSTPSSSSSLSTSPLLGPAISVSHTVLISTIPYPRACRRECITIRNIGTTSLLLRWYPVLPSFCRNDSVTCSTTTFSLQPGQIAQCPFILNPIAPGISHSVWSLASWPSLSVVQVANPSTTLLHSSSSPTHVSPLSYKLTIRTICLPSSTPLISRDILLKYLEAHSVHRSIQASLIDLTSQLPLPLSPSNQYLSSFFTDNLHAAFLRANSHRRLHYHPDLVADMCSLAHDVLMLHPLRCRSNMVWDLNVDTLQSLIHAIPIRHESAIPPYLARFHSLLTRASVRTEPTTWRTRLLGQLLTESVFAHIHRLHVSCSSLPAIQSSYSDPPVNRSTTSNPSALEANIQSRLLTACGLFASASHHGNQTIVESLLDTVGSHRTLLGGLPVFIGDGGYSHPQLPKREPPIHEMLPRPNNTTGRSTFLSPAQIAEITRRAEERAANPLDNKDVRHFTYNHSFNLAVTTCGTYILWMTPDTQPIQPNQDLKTKALKTKVPPGKSTFSVSSASSTTSSQPHSLVTVPKTSDPSSTPNPSTSSSHNPSTSSSSTITTAPIHIDSNVISSPDDLTNTNLTVSSPVYEHFSTRPSSGTSGNPIKSLSAVASGVGFASGLDTQASMVVPPERSLLESLNLDPSSGTRVRRVISELHGLTARHVCCGTDCIWVVLDSGSLVRWPPLSTSSLIPSSQASSNDSLDTINASSGSTSDLSTASTSSQPGNPTLSSPDSIPGGHVDVWLMGSSSTQGNCIDDLSSDPLTITHLASTLPTEDFDSLDGSSSSSASSISSLPSSHLHSMPEPLLRPMPGLEDHRVIQVACCKDPSLGSSATFAITDTGLLFAWGDAASSRANLLGFSHKEGRSSPTLVTGFSTRGLRVREVATGYSHVMVLTDTAAVYAWGCNDTGALGLGDRKPRFVPTLIESISAKDSPFEITDRVDESGLGTGSVNVGLKVGVKKPTLQGLRKIAHDDGDTGSQTGIEEVEEEDGGDHLGATSPATLVNLAGLPNTSSSINSISNNNNNSSTTSVITTSNTNTGNSSNNNNATTSLSVGLAGRGDASPSGNLEVFGESDGLMTNDTFEEDDPFSHVVTNDPTFPSSSSLPQEMGQSHADTSVFGPIVGPVIGDVVNHQLQGNPSQGSSEGLVVSHHNALIADPVKQIDCGYHFSVAITYAGVVYTWGEGKDGALGHGDNKDVDKPRRVEALFAPPAEVKLKPTKQPKITPSQVKPRVSSVAPSPSPIPVSLVHGTSTSPDHDGTIPSISSGQRPPSANSSQSSAVTLTQPSISSVPATSSSSPPSSSTSSSSPASTATLATITTPASTTTVSPVTPILAATATPVSTPGPFPSLTATSVAHSNTAQLEHEKDAIPSIDSSYGTSSFSDEALPPAEIGVVQVNEVRCGPTHCIAITSTNHIYTWGKNNMGQLGLVSDEDQSLPVHLPSLLPPPQCTTPSPLPTFSKPSFPSPTSLGWGNQTRTTAPEPITIPFKVAAGIGLSVVLCRNHTDGLSL